LEEDGKISWVDKETKEASFTQTARG